MDKMTYSSTHVTHFNKSLGEKSGWGLVCVWVLGFRLPLKNQGVEAGCRLQELLWQWADQYGKSYVPIIKGRLQRITLYAHRSRDTCTHSFSGGLKSCPQTRIQQSRDSMANPAAVTDYQTGRSWKQCLLHLSRAQTMSEYCLPGSLMPGMYD